MERFELASEAVGDTFALFVRLPPGYEDDATRRFPLVVQLDANLPTLEEFQVTAGLASRLAQPVIVVGVGYRTPGEAERSRLRDFALPMENPTFRASWAQAVPVAAAPKFHAFLRDELLPHLARSYRLAGPAALFGHSMGGLFTVYAASRHAEGPLFTAYVAASPTLLWDGGQVLTRFESSSAAGPASALLVTAGALEGVEMVGYVEAFAARVSGRPQLRFEERVYEGADHLGSVAPSFRDGLEFVFGAP